MFKKIYVPIDNSDISDKVLREAIRVAKDNGAELKVVHVANLEQIAFGIEMIGVAELKQTLLGVANGLIEHAKSILDKGEVPYSTELLENYSADTAGLITEDARKFGADLFVMGSHKLGTFAHFITGGIVEALANNGGIPVLLITKKRK